MAGLTPRDLSLVPRRTGRHETTSKASNKNKRPGEFMTSKTFNPRLSRRTLVKGAAALGAFQVASPFIIAARGETRDPDRHGRSAHRRLRRAGRQRGDGRQARRRADQRQGRHSRAPGRTAGRRFRQRCRHRRAKGAQADRARSGQLHDRRRQFGHRGRDRAGHQREEDPAHRFRRPHRRDHRQGLQMERLPRLQHDADGGQFGVERAVQQVRQEMALHHARLRLRPYAADGLHRPT